MHICFGLNGIKEANWKKIKHIQKRIALKLFYYLNDSKKSTYDKNFRLTVENLKKEYLAKNKDIKELVKYIQVNTFKEMAKDKFLLNGFMITMN